MHVLADAGIWPGFLNIRILIVKNQGLISVDPDASRRRRRFLFLLSHLDPDGRGHGDLDGLVAVDEHGVALRHL